MEISTQLNQISSGRLTQDKLVALIGLIRPSNATSGQVAQERFIELIKLLSTDEQKRIAFQQLIKQLIGSKNQIRLLTELGLSANPNFFSEFFGRIYEKIFPPAIDRSEAMDLLGEIFSSNKDYIWVESIPDSDWIKLFELAGFYRTGNPIVANEFFTPMLVSLQVLANRTCAMGLESEIMSRLPRYEKLDSPFVALASRMHRYTDAIDNFKEGDEEKVNKHFELIKSTIKQCADQLAQVRENSHRQGVSIKLVYLIYRINQNLNRLLELLTFTELGGEQKINKAVVFFKKLVGFENRKHSVKEHVIQNTDLLAYQIVEHTSHTGEHYISNNSKQYFRALWQSMGGGFVVIFVTWIKYGIDNVKAAPLVEGLLYSLNYSIAFITIYAAHFTLATKQPAMTASALASSLDSKKKEINLDQAAELIVKMARSQFISFFGNLVVVIPGAFFFAWGMHLFTGELIISEAKALKTLANNDAFASLSILYAGIAGVFLFLSGLISGYYDNKVDYAQLPKRIREHKFLRKYLSKKLLFRISRYLDRNLGGLAGNFFLGFFLGLAGFIGFITGLPFDVRHVTLASGSVSMSIYTLGFNLPIETFLSVGLGITFIGLMNFSVSFGLALFVAIKSRKVNFIQTKELLNIVYAHFLARPRDFFIPPRKKKIKTPNVV